MAVIQSRSFPLDAVTPVCNSCMIFLCYDIGNDEYNANRKFWNNWECSECNPEYRFKKGKVNAISS